MKSAVNLLPMTLRRQQIVRRRVVQWTSLICTVLVLGWAWHWWEMGEDRALVKQLEVLEREHAPTQRMLKQLIEMRRQLDELQHQETVASELERQRHALTLLGVISQASQKADGRLRVTKLELTDFQNTNRPEGIGAAGGAGLLLGGVSIDNPSVAELMDELQDSGIFSRVELLALKEREDKDAALRDYEVRCEF